MSFTPPDMVAVADNSQKRFWVYFVDTDGDLAIYRGPEDFQKESGDPYIGPAYIQFGDESNKTAVKANTNSRLAVCDYVQKENIQQVYTHITLST
jgi:hypothetical protein